ncbi:MAG: radical SAM protein, partial [Planctomycetota bacterium]|nr:radical SAM protein [Planctomycetota bacterium]
MAGWHAPWVDWLRRWLSPDLYLRRYAKAAVEDLRSLWRWRAAWRTLAEQPPPALFLEPTNRCNANCVFCAYRYQRSRWRDEGTMALAVSSAACEQYRALGGGHIIFTPVVGEPLLDPHILERIRAAKAQGLTVDLSTNGILLGRLPPLALIAAGLDTLAVSLPPLDAESLRRLFRATAYGELLTGLEELLRTRNAQASALRVRLLFRSDLTAAETLSRRDYVERILPLLKPAERQEVYVQIRAFDNWGGLIAAQDLPGMMRLAAAPRLKRRPCLWTFMPIVLWDG